ncbi:hypothetical protein HDU76_012267, partial [Blyttiomyces sp. JEL0837]
MLSKLTVFLTTIITFTFTFTFASINFSVSQAQQQPLPPPVTISLDYITLQGSTTPSGNTHVYKEIPYAAPPIGDNRWKPPLPPLNYSSMGGVYDATVYREICWQDGSEIVVGEGDVQSEDCLFLNIWAPASSTSTTNLSVMVWIHGGAFMIGSGNEKRYSGESIVESSNGNVVFVNFNYRLGVFGFFGNKWVVEEARTEGTGGVNFGLLDMEMALF